MPTDREQHTGSIWVTPPDAALECLAKLVQAKDLDQLASLSLPFQNASIDRAEHRLEMQLERMGPLGATLRREMRPSLLERFEDFWQNLRDRFGGGHDEDAASDDAFAFELVLNETFPTHELDGDNETVEREIRRFLADLAAIIETGRGYGGKQVRIADDALDFLEDQEDWSADDEVLAEIPNIAAYWLPSSGKPALALSRAQQDSGLPITIKLIAHSEKGHQHFLEVLRLADGDLS